MSGFSVELIEEYRSQLKSTGSPEEFNDVARQIIAETDPGGSTTILYTGYVNEQEGLHTGQAAANLASQDSSARTINQTAIGDVLDNTAVRQHLADLNNVDLSSPDIDRFFDSSELINGKPISAFDVASDEFARRATGNVIFLNYEGNFEKIGGVIEMAAVIERFESGQVDEIFGLRKGAEFDAEFRNLDGTINKTKLFGEIQNRSVSAFDSPRSKDQDPAARPRRRGHGGGGVVREVPDGSNTSLLHWYVYF